MDKQDAALDQGPDRGTTHFELPVSDLPVDLLSPQLTRFVVGEQDDEGAPVVVCGCFPPGFVLGPHTHDTDYSEIILKGSQRVGRRWYLPGDSRVVSAGTVYGPLEAGPEGAVVLVVFRDGRRMMKPPRAGVGVWFEARDSERAYVVKRELPE